MKTFLKTLLTHSVQFSILCLIIFIPLIFLFEEHHYSKVTSPKSCSLILGSSRAGESMVPAVFDSILHAEITGDFINFAFNLGVAPFGKIYHEAILKKFKNSCNQSISIICVNPWSISTDQFYRNEKTFRESRHFLNNMSSVSIKPNLQYIFSKENPFKALFVHISNPFHIKYKNGYTNQTVFTSPSPKLIKKQTEKVINFYKNNYLKNFDYSAVRVEYLSETISFLSDRSNVFIVRLPIGEEILEIENKYMANFNEIMLSLAEKHGSTYLNFSKDNHDITFIDGHHVFKGSAAKVSSMIANRMKIELRKVD